MFGDKPLFTRAQLSLVMVGATLAIALLANFNTGARIPEVQRLEVDSVPVYWSPAFDNRPYLLVQLALPVASDALLVDILVAELATRLSPETEARRYHDRWELLLPGTAAELPALLARLREPLVAARWQQLGQRERARRYLEGTLPGAALDREDAGFGARAATFHQNLLARTQLSLSMTGAAPDPGKAPWKAALAALPAGPPWPHHTVTGGDGSPNLILLPGRADPGFAQAALAVQLLRPLAEAHGVTWQFLPGGASSRLSVAASPAALEALRRDAALLGPEQVDAARTRLTEALKAAMEDPRLYARQQGVQAFYRLALDYWSRFIDTIAALPPQAPLEQLRGWLDQVAASDGSDYEQKTQTDPGRGA